MWKHNWLALVFMAGTFLAPCLRAQSGAGDPDLPAGAMKVKATDACTQCHESRIILQQRLSKAAWTKEVDKMVKWGAPVDPQDRDALIEYLSSNFGTDRPAYVPDHTSSSKPPKK